MLQYLCHPERKGSWAACGQVRRKPIRFLHECARNNLQIARTTKRMLGQTARTPHRRKFLGATQINYGSRADPRMLQKIKSTFREIKDGEPGHRFVDHFKRSRQKEGTRAGFWKTAGQVGAGLALFLCGLLLSLPPGVPGFLLWVPGIALIAARSRYLSFLLDRLEVWARRVWPGKGA